MVSKEMPPKVDLTIDITKGTFMNWIMEAFSTLAQDENRVLRVIGKSSKDPTVLVEVLIDEAPMRPAMWEYSQRIFNLSIVISLFSADLVFFSAMAVGLAHAPHYQKHGVVPRRTGGRHPDDRSQPASRRSRIC